MAEGAAGYFPILQLGNACCSSAMPAAAIRVIGTGETGVMVGLRWHRFHAHEIL